MNYREKYLKYKMKYLKLIQKGGNSDKYKYLFLTLDDPVMVKQDDLIYGIKSQCGIDNSKFNEVRFDNFDTIINELEKYNNNLNLIGISTHGSNDSMMVGNRLNRLSIKVDDPNYQKFVDRLNKALVNNGQILLFSCCLGQIITQNYFDNFKSSSAQIRGDYPNLFPNAIFTNCKYQNFANNLSNNLEKNNTVYSTLGIQIAGEWEMLPFYDTSSFFTQNICSHITEGQLNFMNSKQNLMVYSKNNNISERKQIITNYYNSTDILFKSDSKPDWWDVKIDIPIIVQFKRYLISWSKIGLETHKPPPITINKEKSNQLAKEIIDFVIKNLDYLNNFNIYNILIDNIEFLNPDYVKYLYSNLNSFKKTIDMIVLDTILIDAFSKSNVSDVLKLDYILQVYTKVTKVYMQAIIDKSVNEININNEINY